MSDPLYVCHGVGFAGRRPYVFADPGSDRRQRIVDAANKNGCDVIAMGSHGKGGVKQFFVGSETTRVLSHTKIPVMVYR